MERQRASRAIVIPDDRLKLLSPRFRKIDGGLGGGHSGRLRVLERRALGVRAVNPPSAEPGKQIAALLATAIIAALPRASRVPFVVGLCGPQGSGKSTAGAVLKRALRANGLSAAVLSLDDIYLSRGEREALAAIHPLLRVRGVPGTHDPALGLALIAALGGTGRVPAPRFDKNKDDRRKERESLVAPVDVVIFEGWCVGAAPQAPAALARPVNALERDEDGDGRWRAWVNQRLATDYRTLFARLDLLALITAPSFAVISGWRRQQEAALRAALAARGEPAIHCMSDTEIDRFVQHYQRLTEHILTEMPARADLVIRLDAERNLLSHIRR